MVYNDYTSRLAPSLSWCSFPADRIPMVLYSFTVSSHNDTLSGLFDCTAAGTTISDIPRFLYGMHCNVVIHCAWYPYRTTRSEHRMIVLSLYHGSEVVAPWLYTDCATIELPPRSEVVAPWCYIYRPTHYERVPARLVAFGLGGRHILASGILIWIFTILQPMKSFQCVNNSMRKSELQRS